MKVTIADFRRDYMDNALELFRSLQKERDVQAVELDVTDRAGFSRAADAAAATFCPVHVLVSNAGLGIIGPITETTFADWDFGLGVNLGGAVNALGTFLPRIVKHGQGGHIVLTSSMSAVTPSPRNATIYATSKAALLAMGEAMREELADNKI